MEHAYRFSESLQYSKSPVASAALLGGPIWEDAIGAVAFKRGLAEILTRNLPGYGARGLLEKVTGAKLDNPVLRGAKKFDKAALEAIGVRQPPKTGLEIDTSIRYAEGGRVGYAEGDEIKLESIRPASIFEPKVDVVGTTDDPKERINPKTGEPYTAIYKKPRVGLVLGGASSKLIQKFFAKTPVKRATDKKWTTLSITDESDKVVGLVQNVPDSPGNSYIKSKTPEFQQYLIDNQIGRQSKTVDSQFFFDTSSQKSINKELNKPFNVDTSYRMQHQARSVEEGGARLDDMTGGGEVFPSDIYSPQGLRYYGNPDNKFDRESFEIIQKVRGNPNAEVTIYRAVPKDDSIKTINEGDFVTLSKTYAEMHGASGYGRSGDEAGKIISKKVKVKDLVSEGNDLNEFGYFPSKD
jgi:hypothetical protein